MAKSIARYLADVASTTGVLDGTLSTAAQTNITSLGTLTALTVDNLGINGNTITANSGALNLTPASGSAIVLDGTINVDAGVVTGATSITSTAFVGGLTGNVTGNVSGTAATVTGAAQTNITSLGTLTTLTVDDITINGSTISDAADLILDVGGDITLDVDGGDVLFKDGGTHFGSIYQNSNNMLIYSAISNADMLFQGNDSDGSNPFTALTLDMSAAGEATFNSNIISGGKIGVGTGASTINSDSIMHLKSAQPNIYFEDTDDSKSWRLEAGSVFKVQNITTSTEAFRIDQSGNFGIGIAPSSMLHLYDGGTDTKITVQSRVAADATASLLLMSRLADNSNKNVTLQAYRGNLSITGDSGYGRVGIGTAPTDFFDVLGSSSTYDIGTDDTAAVVANFVPDVTNNRNGRFRIAGTTTPSNNSVALISDASTNVGMTFVTTSGGTRGERMVIDSAGNVGIGAARGGASPNASLQVAGENNGYDGTIRVGERAYFAHRDSGNTKTWVANNYNNDSATFGIRIKGIADTDEKLTVLGSGYVGIGTSSPDTAVHISTADRNIIKFHSSYGTARTYYFRNDSGVLNIGGGTPSDSNDLLNLDVGNGRVGIGTKTPLKTFHVQGGSNIDTMMINNVSGNNTNRYGGIAGINYAGNQSALINYYSDSGQTYLHLGSNGNTSFRGPTMIRLFAASGPDTTSHVESFRVTHKRAIATGGDPRTPDVAMEINGPLKITNNTGGGISQTHTNMSAANSGKLLINFASIGTMTSGDTIVFTYSAISWKSWFFKIRWSSTGGYMGELWAGGYNNTSDGYGIFNPKNSGANDDGSIQSTTDGATLTVTRSGQANTMTLTLNNTHVHPLFEIEYACGGGEGYPQASRASITVNS